MVIDAISDEYKKYLNASHYQSLANIELRPNGILVHFRHKLQAYSWMMSFSDLQIVCDEALTLRAAGKFIRFKAPVNEKFIKRMQELMRKTS